MSEHVIFMIPAKWRSNANVISVIYVDFDIQLWAGLLYLYVKPLSEHPQLLVDTLTEYNAVTKWRTYLY